MGRKIYVTAAEMLELRKQGMSNHDIAKSLDICCATVLNYIGKQDGKMEGLAAFKDAPPPKKEEVKEEAVKPMIPKYEPKISSESFGLKFGSVTLSYDKRCVILKPEIFDEESALRAVTIHPAIKFDDVPELVQFLAWAMRTRMEVTADAEQVREQENDSEWGDI